MPCRVADKGAGNPIIHRVGAAEHGFLKSRW